MKKMLMFGGAIILTAIFSWSCHLGDFDLNKLAKVDIKPVFYIPLAYGGYTVGNFVNIPQTNTDTIVGEIDLNPIIYDKTGVSVNIKGLDSVYLEVNFTNGTPMKMQVLFDFIDKATGTAISKVYDSGLMPAGTMDPTGKVVQSVSTKVEFPMDSTDLDNITTADGIEFTIKLFQPDTGAVIVKNLKTSLINVQISVRAPYHYGS
jgi:hypothetical protein